MNNMQRFHAALDWYLSAKNISHSDSTSSAAPVPFGTVSAAVGALGAGDTAFPAMGCCVAPTAGPGALRGAASWEAALGGSKEGAAWVDDDC